MGLKRCKKVHGCFNLNTQKQIIKWSLTFVQASLYFHTLKWLNGEANIKVHGSPALTWANLILWFEMIAMIPFFLCPKKTWVEMFCTLSTVWVVRMNLDSCKRHRYFVCAATAKLDPGEAVEKPSVRPFSDRPAPPLSGTRNSPDHRGNTIW